ncbi:GerAB/ArcD/ProY family transporter [Bacillus toyonensis]|uniref:Spore gernimation protein n=1 Tax=Bacillus toyonensis TaxID=155322 RepID=A0A2B5Y2D4_9BACI|nr:GerAB/ArcD/ProY family transporter [Bacillus toyonensis]PGB02620.1 spore gernimation protein [Bacillus toyonensis]PHD66739.1 spore gernimation protein [Bacillus toyonensis]
MKTYIKDQLLVPPFLVFFLVQCVQFGTGVLSFQRNVVKTSGHDAWIPILLNGLIVHVLIWMIYQILDKEKADLIFIHEMTFGKWIGGLFSTLFILYSLSLSLITLRTFIEIVQVWMFPLLKTWPFALTFLLSVYYVVSNGFRTVTGICFLGVVIPFYLFFTFLVPLEFSHFRNLLPVFDHSFKEMVISLKETTFSFVGFEFILLYYPFIHKPETSQKWAHWGNFLSMTVYLFIMVVTLVYFDLEHLKQTTWPTLTMWKIIELPFVERFEFIGIASWTFVILPNLCVYLWAASRGTRELIKIKQRKALIFFLFLCLIGNYFLKDHESIQMLEKSISIVSRFTFYIYIPLLFIIYHVRFKVRKKS